MYLQEFPQQMVMFTRSIICHLVIIYSVFLVHLLLHLMAPAVVLS